MPLLLTIPQAAAELTISRSRLYELIAQGEIRSVHIGALHRIEPAALREYVAALDTARTPA